MWARSLAPPRRPLSEAGPGCQELEEEEEPCQEQRLGRCSPGHGQSPEDADPSLLEAAVGCNPPELDNVVVAVGCCNPPGLDNVVAAVRHQRLPQAQKSAHDSSGHSWNTRST